MGAGAAPEPAPAWPGHTVDCCTGLSRSRMVFSSGLTLATWASTPADVHETRNWPRRIGPWASWVEKMAGPSWLSQESQNR